MNKEIKLVTKPFVTCIAEMSCLNSEFINTKVSYEIPYILDVIGYNQEFREALETLMPGASSNFMLKDEIG